MYKGLSAPFADKISTLRRVQYALQVIGEGITSSTFVISSDTVCCCSFARLRVFFTWKLGVEIALEHHSRLCQDDELNQQVLCADPTHPRMDQRGHGSPCAMLPLQIGTLLL